MSEARKYSQEEAEEILRRALRRQQATEATGDHTSHTDLVEAAREVGIDPANIEEAARDLAAEKQSSVKRESVLGPARRRFARHLTTYLVVNAALFGMDYVGGEGWWFHWVLFGWGIGVALEAVRILFPSDEFRQSEALRAARREERRQRLLARATRRHQHGDFEQAVEAGVTALLSAIARRIRAEIEPPAPRRDVERLRVGGTADTESETAIAPPRRESGSSNPRR